MLKPGSKGADMERIYGPCWGFRIARTDRRSVVDPGHGLELERGRPSVLLVEELEGFRDVAADLPEAWHQRDRSRWVPHASNACVVCLHDNLKV